MQTTYIPQIVSTGSHFLDRWRVDGDQNFAWFPENLLPQVQVSIPIRLHIGNASFGQVHIEKRHGHWLRRLNTTATLLVWQQLQKTGLVYASDKAGALKLNFCMSPQSLMVLELREKPEPYFSVVTLYEYQRRVDGQYLGRYRPKKEHTQK